MRIEIDSGNLDSLDEAVADMKRFLSGDDGDTGDLINAAKALLAEAETVLECATGSSDYERPNADDVLED